MYLLSGGLGGIAVEIAKYLLQHYEARLLLVGRTRLPDRKTWEPHLEAKGAVSERIRAYQTLEEHGGEIAYEAIDICDVAQLQHVVDQFKSRWKCDLDGVLHLAGTYQERLLVEETRDSFAETLRPKVLGTWALHQLLKDQPHSVFISFSSVNGFFGGISAGAYAAANGFMDVFSHYQRTSKDLVRSYCLAWSLWDEVGMSRGYQMKDLSRARGYYPISAEQGIYSLLAGLHDNQAHLIVGLDGSNPRIQRYTEIKSYQAKKICAYYTTRTDQYTIAKMPDIGLQDRFGTPSTCDFVQIQEMPLTEGGMIDRERLVGDARQRTSNRVGPRTAFERQIVTIWQEVLGAPEVGIHDNFFVLGGHSLLATQVTARLCEAFAVELPLRSFFQFPTVAGLASELTQRENRQEATPELPAIVSFPEHQHSPFPLTDVQEAYWIGRTDAFELGNVSTHLYWEVQSVDLDLDRLNTAWRRLIDRHDMLRAIVLPDGRQQILEEVPPYEIEVLDLDGQESQKVESALESVRERMSHQVLPSDQWPLFEIRASRLDEQCLRLHFSFDVLILDAWSLFLLFREWSELYRDPKVSLPPLELTFRDYVLAEKELRDSELYQRSKDYWWSRLPALPPAPDLPLVVNPASVNQPRFSLQHGRLERET